MGVIKVTPDFDDRQLHLDAEAEQYHPYEYQTENNDSWAGALPVKQYVSSMTVRDGNYSLIAGDCTTRPLRKMPAVSALLGKSICQPWQATR